MDKLLNRGKYSIEDEVKVPDKKVKPVWKIFGIGNEFTIDIQGNKIKATIIKEPAFDPENLRLKS